MNNIWQKNADIVNYESKSIQEELDCKCKESQSIDLIYIFNVMHAEEWYVIKYRSKCKKALWESKNKNYKWQENGVHSIIHRFFFFLLDIYNVTVPLIVSSFLGFSEIY